MAGNDPAPVIIKRKKVVSGEGHHGGAWKVAYADFVTAMMAFFMLMWLLNATTEKQRKGIADYFNPTIPVNRISGGGDGMFGGTDIFAQEVLARSGTGGNQTRKDAHSAEQDQETKTLEALSEAFTGMGDAGDLDGPLSENFAARVTEQGLSVDIFSSADNPIFEGDSGALTAFGADLVRVVSKVFQRVPNSVTITGHSAGKPIVLRSNTLWDVSIQRGQSARDAMLQAGFPEARIQEIGGQAAREPIREPSIAVENNRLEFVLLRSFPLRPSRETR